MIYERKIEVLKEGEKIVYRYYVKESYSHEFERLMYHVGAESGEGKSEIVDFSHEKESAMKFCDYLFSLNATEKTIFLLGEEFIEENNI